jgi:hypothetical protein
MKRNGQFNSDGFQIAGVLFEPESAPIRSCPAVVLCQGGDNPSVGRHATGFHWTQSLGGYGRRSIERSGSPGRGPFPPAH